MAKCAIIFNYTIYKIVYLNVNKLMSFECDEK
jgi:hypothetical protein